MLHRLLTILAWATLITGTSLLLFVGNNVYQSSKGHQDGLDTFKALREARVEDGSSTAVANASESLPALSLSADTSIATVFSESFEAAADDVDELVERVGTLAAPDTSDWSEKRISDYNKLAAAATEEILPAGIIRIPAVDIELPVFEGTAEYSLTRGAGLIEGTAPLGGKGNTGLAAHRDGYFRALKSIKVGDDILIETLDDDHKYRIVDLSIVYPEDTYVLDPTERDSLTLVTCYPFYFVGSAPQRFIVHAEKL